MLRTFIKFFVIISLLFSGFQTSAFYHCNLFWKYEGDGLRDYINVTNINYIRVARVNNIDNLYKFNVAADIVDNGTDLECANSDCYASPATLSAGTMIYDDVSYNHRLNKYPADNGTLRQRILDKMSVLTCSSSMQAIIQEDLDSGTISGISPSDWEDYILCFTRAMDFPSKPADVRIEGEIHWESDGSNSGDIAVSVSCDIEGTPSNPEGGNGSPDVPVCKDEQLECTRYDTRVPYRWSRKAGELCIGGKHGKECEIEKPEPPVEPQKPEPPKPKVEDLTYLEPDLRDIYDDFLAKKRELEEIKKLESEEGVGLRIYPKVLLKTGTPVTDRTYIQRTSKIETSLAKNSYQYAGYFENNINFRTKKLVSEDRNKSLYIVIPTNGLVMPINTVPNGNEDFTKLVSGKSIEVNKYLKTGTLLYPNTSIKGFGEVGNKVIFGHSSYWKKDDGRYKTEFQKIIELDNEEEIWIFEKQYNGEYKRYRYKVRITYPVSDDNTYPLEPSIGKNLTLITCTPIGGVTGRWVVSAKYIDENKKDLENYIYGEYLSFDYKIKIQKFLNKLDKYNDKEKKKIILRLYKTILKYESEGKLDKYIQAINYLKLKIAIKYFE